MFTKPENNAIYKASLDPQNLVCLCTLALCLQKETDKGLIPFILFALGMGFFALLTPCVFPMIPITVSYFTKLGESKNKDESITPLTAASIYALGIVIIFSLLLYQTVIYEHSPL